MKKLRDTHARAPLLGMCLLLALVAQNALGDVVPGEVVDSSNWKKAEGLVPGLVLEQVKAGRIKINVGEIGYNPSDYQTKSIRDRLESNKDRYYVDDDGSILEMATKKPPSTYYGVPFPEIDSNDPTAGYQVHHNVNWSRQSLKNPELSQRMGWVGKKGLEREVSSKLTSMAWAHEEWQDVANPENFEVQIINMITAPFDVAGTAIMIWQRRGAAIDSNFAYVPAIRRCRRTSPAARSDSMFGSDFTTDDIGVDNSKTESFVRKYLRTQKALVPFLSPQHPVQLVKQQDGSYAVDTNLLEGARFGFETDGWDGAPWAVTNWTWAERKVHVVEATPKNPYYNAGKTEIWYDAGTYQPSMKITYDRGGNLWKLEIGGIIAYSAPDGFTGLDNNGGLLVYDVRTDHATVNWGTHQTTQTYFNKPFSPDDFTLAGFVKFCK